MESYFIHDGIAPSGPYTLEELKDINIHAEQAVWSPEMKVWIDAGQVLALQSIIKRGKKSYFDSPRQERTKQTSYTPIFILTTLILLFALGLLFWRYIHHS